MFKEILFSILLISAAALVTYLFQRSQSLKKTFVSETSKALSRTEQLPKEPLTENDIAHLPLPVQKYLRYAGVIGKEKVYSFRAVCDGEMQLNRNKGWSKISSIQYNVYDAHPTRMFYIKLSMFGLPILGLHSYTDEYAYMHIKILGLITVLNARGPEMRIGDTTTLFNDMCFFAPATLIDKRIQWEEIDSLTAKATFENNGYKISATLYFNDKGELIDFTSEDRYYIPMDGSSRKALWSTPISRYREINGLRLPSYGEAVWKLPEGDYCYAKFSNIKEVKYNCSNIK